MLIFKSLLMTILPRDNAFQLFGQTLYKLNLKGELISVLKTEKENGSFMAKRNGLFYGLSKRDGRIFVYKEEL